MPSKRPAALTGVGALPFGGGWAFLYLLLAIGYTWPVWTPGLFGGVPSTDFALSAGLMAHVADWLTGRAALFDVGMFYPLPDTLCLSEAFLTPGILMAPLIWLMGPLAAAHCYVVLCSWTSACAAHYYLRLRGVATVGAVAGACWATFSVDRTWHAAGHLHLLFQAGFPLSLALLEKIAREPHQRRWTVGLGVTILLQAACGWYMAVLLAAWLALLGPVSLALGAGGLGRLRVVWRRSWRGLLAALVLPALLLSPVAWRYAQYGATRPENRLIDAAPHSATWRGYLLPPRDPGRVATATGWVLLAARGPAAFREDTEYVGLVPLAAIGVALVLRAVGRMKSAKVPRGRRLWLQGLACMGVVGAVLSVGPGWGQDATGHWPFGIFWDWVPPLRFFRSPGRWAFLVQWALGLAAGAALADLVTVVLPSRRRVAAVGVVSFTLLDTFPATRLPFMDARAEPSTIRLAQGGDSHPMLVLPDSSLILNQWVRYRIPMANGTSGYAPQGRDIDLALVAAEFPSTRTLELVRRWGIQRVLVRESLPAARRQACMRRADLEPIWTTSDAVLYGLQLTTPAPLIKAGGDVVATLADWRPIADSGKALGGGRFEITSAPLRLLAPRLTTPVVGTPSATAELTLQVRFARARQRIGGLLRWRGTRGDAVDAVRAVPFLIAATDQLQKIEVPVGSSVLYASDQEVAHWVMEIAGSPGDQVTVGSVVLKK